MAAPLPTGSTLQALPQAPQIQDPRLYASNPNAALATAHAGMMLGQEFANLDNVQSQRELDAAKIKLAKAQNDVDMLHIDEARRQLPAHVADMVSAGIQEQLATSRAAAAKSGNELALSNARASAGYPAAQAGLEVASTNVAAAQAGNALASATADLDFAKQPLPGRTQQLEAAKTLGGWGISQGGVDAAAGDIPIPFREFKTITEFDKETGDTTERAVVFDKRDPAKFIKGPVIAITKAGVDEKSTQQAAREATAVIASRDMALKLDAALDAYIKADAGGLGQALATNLANKAPTGPISVIAKAAGAKAQSAATVALAGEVQTLKNSIGNTLFGSALSKEESTQLQGTLPTVEDLADPKRAKEKLKGTIEFLDIKLKPLVARGAGKVPGLIDKPAPASGAITGPRDGQIRYLRGRKVRVVTGEDGKKYYEEVK